MIGRMGADAFAAASFTTDGPDWISGSGGGGVLFMFMNVSTPMIVPTTVAIALMAVQKPFNPQPPNSHDGPLPNHMQNSAGCLP